MIGFAIRFVRSVIPRPSCVATCRLLTAGGKSGSFTIGSMYGHSSMMSKIRRRPVAGSPSRRAGIFSGYAHWLPSSFTRCAVVRPCPPPFLGPGFPRSAGSGLARDLAASRRRCYFGVIRRWSISLGRMRTTGGYWIYCVLMKAGWFVCAMPSELRGGRGSCS